MISSALYNMGHVKWKSVFEHAQKLQIHIMLHTHRVSFGLHLNIQLS